MRSGVVKRWAVMVTFGAGLWPGMQAQQAGVEPVVVLTLVGRPLPIVAGEMHGTFAKYSVAVKTQNFPNSGLMRKALADGTGDLAYAAVDNAVAMVEPGGADVAIVSGGEGSQNELMVQPAVKSFDDLRGKTLLVDAVNTAYALQLKGILLRHGMRAGQDYQMNAYGATPLRLAALLQHKELTGSMLPPPFSIEARRGGLTTLASVPAVLGAYQAGGHFTKRQWAAQHRDLLVRYLAAYIESQRWLMAPENKEQVIGLMMKEGGLERSVAVENYAATMNEPGGFENDARLDAEGFENVLKLRADVEGEWKGPLPAAGRFYDASYYDAALAMLH